jgi:TRAP-type transport system small permease protein
MRYLNSILKTFLLLSLFGLIAVVVIQIFGRLFLPKSPGWTEEAARLCFVYLVSLGAGLAIKEKAYVNVELWLHRMPARLQKLVLVVLNIFVLVLMLLMTLHAIPFVRIGLMQTSPSLQIPMAFSYFSMLLMPVLIFIYTFAVILQLIKIKKT